MIFENHKITSQNLLILNLKRFEQLLMEIMKTREGKPSKKSKTKETKDQNRILVLIDLNPHLPKITEVFRKHHKSMLFNALHISEMFLTSHAQLQTT
jgi:hypothetical protein